MIPPILGVLQHSIHINIISMELSILYFKGLSIKISTKRRKIVLISSNGADSDEMPPFCVISSGSLPFDNSAVPDEILPYATFHLGLYCF